MSYVTRIAPSPTGDMHLGTARTAYFNWLAARASGGSFILRIDDTDTARNDSSKVDDILAIMDWLGLDYDELHFQSQRQVVYDKFADNLLQQLWAKRLDDGAIVMNLGFFNVDHQTYFKDTLGIPDHWTDSLAGDIALTNSDWDQAKNLVLMKSTAAGGGPTYNFASLVDDIDLGINFVIRGTDHIKNTAKQVLLNQFIRPTLNANDIINHTKYPLPKFAHVGMLTKKKKKLSKRDGAASMLAYRDAGYNPDAILNFLLRLGWGPKVDDKTTKIITKDRALELFLDGGKMRAAPSNIDIQKLDSFDRKYKGRLRAQQS
jgi:glutamyl-tRNA synthetase